MKRWIALAFALFLLGTQACALDLPSEAEAALPPDLLEQTQREGLLDGTADHLWAQLRFAWDESWQGALRRAAELMLASILCAAAEGFGSGAARLAPWCGVLAVTAISAGEMTSFLALGAQTVGELAATAKLLLPTLAAAMASGGLVATAGAWQIATLFACNGMLEGMERVLLPLTYCFVGISAAGVLLPESNLEQLAEGVRKAISWALCAMVGIFTAYLSLSNVLTGTADRTAVKAARLAISGTVPVVGRILSDAAESVLAGAGALRGTIGALGIAAILSVALVPLVRLGMQYLLYQAAAFVAAAVGTKEVQKLLQAIAGAFGLVLGMTAACALMLVVALLVAVTMVVTV